MVLHISSEMTKSLSQCPWPPAFLLVLLHSHSLMWPWTGIGHRPHSRDWYRLCCSHAYKSAELGGRLVSVWKSLSVSRLHSSTEMGGNYKCNNLETRSLSSYYVWAKTKARNSASATKCQNENLPLMYTHILEDKRSHFTSSREVTYWHYTSCKWGMLTTEKKLN